MTNEMKAFFVTLSILPTLFCLIMASVLAYNIRPPETWGWFLAVGFAGFFLFFTTLESVAIPKKEEKEDKE